MKTRILLAVTVFATTLSTSCSNSEEDLLPIVGTWLLDSSSTEEFTNNISDGTTTETIDADNFIRVTFNADGTFSEFESYTSIVNGEVIVETSTDSGTYSTFGNLLFVTYDGDTDDGDTDNGDTDDSDTDEGDTDEGDTDEGDTDDGDTDDGNTDTETAEFTLIGTRLGIVFVEEFTEENGDQKRLVTIAIYNKQ